ncbi:MAG: nitroreductase family protein [Synergistales bacterium]|nr:nitroreductase family protein [Synergistales bacterium]
MLDLLRTRRSIRKFQDQPLEKEKVEILKEAVLRSPSSRNVKPWHFIFVDDRELLLKLASSKRHGAEFLEGAPLGIVVLGDENQTDVWVEDCSIATFTAHLTAHSLGLGSCWIQIRNRDHSDYDSAEEYIQDLLAIPDHMRVESIIAIGYPGEEKEGVALEEIDFSRVSLNTFR